jgi:hypothetical protein
LSGGRALVLAVAEEICDDFTAVPRRREAAGTLA